jgi:hypothetical protein
MSGEKSMLRQRMIGTVIAGIALGAVAMPLATTVFAAPAITAGLVPLSVQGIGAGSFATGVSTCGGLSCQVAGNCDCLGGTDTLVGNQGFAKGTLTFSLLIDLTETNLLTADFGNCVAATGSGILANPGSKNTVNVDMSGLACNTNSGLEVFNGTYVVTGGGGKYSASSGGTGAINGSQKPAGGANSSQVAVAGSLQQTAP